jgi:pimeloyl-ACP methyl ester carboxylesterase
MAWFAGRYAQERVALTGDSRGGEGVLLIASTFPDQVSALIPAVPSNMVFAGVDISNFQPVPGWTLNGEPLPYIEWKFSDLRPSQQWPGSQEARHIYREAMLEHDYDDPRWIQVENIKSPILLISGDSDAVWPSDLAAERVVARLKAKNFQYPVQHLAYEGGGHLVGMPALVKSRGEFAESVLEGIAGLTIGGFAASNAQAQTDAFRRTVDFIKHYESADN